ncbi:MAG: winged helix-turn-helix transcriptional regulator [Candidatus Omnitrophica bacterium]|nr:winged helix-turn-helix transcriptional regulator [Candidatus Omnitrophota bacterium]
MLEAFVSSRIRRALFEHILAHPAERFYLRGLAKQLGLSVSPLRRELKRLEHSGMLKGVQEGNMLFYLVDQASSDFLQLKQVGQQTEAPSEARLEAGSAPPVLIPIRRPVLRSPALIGAAGAGLALLLIMAGLLYVTVTQQRLASQASRALATRRAEVTVVVPPTPSSSGAMRGSRWQIVPGGFGGFSSGASDASY